MISGRPQIARSNPALGLSGLARPTRVPDSPPGCPVCETDVSRRGSRGPYPTTHYLCGRMVSHLRAAIRYALEICRRRPAARRLVRAALMAAVNRVPVDWERPRGADGRFQKEEE